MLRRATRAIFLPIDIMQHESDPRPVPAEKERLKSQQAKNSRSGKNLEMVKWTVSCDGKSAHLAAVKPTLFVDQSSDGALGSNCRFSHGTGSQASQDSPLAPPDLLVESSVLSLPARRVGRERGCPGAQSRRRARPDPQGRQHDKEDRKNRREARTKATCGNGSTKV
jgi:hypothetical protein